MTDSNHNLEPMIKLEPSGIAPVISYNVPEPTSYSGRNFIDLQLGASYFKPTPPAGGSSLNASAASLASGPDATDALASLIMEAASPERAAVETPGAMSLMSRPNRLCPPSRRDSSRRGAWRLPRRQSRPPARSPSSPRPR